MARKNSSPTAAKRGPAIRLTGEHRDGPIVQFNVLRHGTSILVKQIERRPDGTLRKQHGGQIPRGSTVSTEKKPLNKYLGDAFHGGVRQYILPANVEIGTDVPISAKQFVVPGGVDRTAETLFYADGPAPFTLDHDPSPYSATALNGPEALHNLLAELFPDAFSAAAWGGYDSSSSFIYDQSGNEIAGRKGFHVAYAIENATQIPEFADRLFKRLWLDGHGYIHVSKSGGALPRTIFDKKVVEPQQPLFAGGAYCVGCKQRRPKPVGRAGGYITTAGVPLLTQDEEGEYRRLVDAKIRDARPECERKKREYLKTEVEALLTKQNIDIESARRIVESRVGGTLIGNDILHFDDHGDVTVAAVLTDHAKYDEATLADPVDGDVTGKAILYINAGSGRPVVFSHAHGGGVFFLKHDIASLMAVLQKLDRDQALKCWHSNLPYAELRSDEQEQYLVAVKNKTGIGIGALRKTAQVLLRQTSKSAAQGLEQDPGLYLANLLLERSYRDGTTLIKLESGYFWKYTGTHWTNIKDTVLSGDLQRLAEEQWNHILKMWESFGKKPSTLSGLVTSALACLGSKVIVGGDPLRLNAPRPSVINCTNGELWLIDEGPQLRPHQPESYLTSCSPIRYDPSAKAPTFEIAMRGILSSEGGEPMSDQDEMLRHFEELLGYSIQTRRNLKVFVLIVGPGDNGKTRIVKLLEIILGNDAIASDRLSGVDEGNNRFATVRLVGKQVLIDDDVDHGYMLPDGLLKKIAEEKPLTAEGKFKDSFTFIAQVVPWLLGNSWPRSRDLTRGMQTRANVLYLPRSFLKPSECDDDHPDRQRPELWDKIYCEEMPGVLNRLVEGYYRVARRNGFLPPPSAKKAFDMWIADANVVSRFVEEGCERIDPTKPGCTTGFLFQAFVKWAEANGVQPYHRPQLNQMKKRLEEIGLRVKHTDEGTAVFGIRPLEVWTIFSKANPFAEKLLALTGEEVAT